MPLTVKYLVRMDDALDLFAEHAVGGIVGLLMNAFFASTDIIALDGVNIGIDGGFVDKVWKALYKQVAYIAATCAYTFVMTALIAKGVDLIPGLKIRTTPEGEIIGIDETDVSISPVSRRMKLLSYAIHRLVNSPPTTLSFAARSTIALALLPRRSSGSCPTATAMVPATLSVGRLASMARNRVPSTLSTKKRPPRLETRKRNLTLSSSNCTPQSIFSMAWHRISYDLFIPYLLIRCCTLGSLFAVL